jgi:hypothetical protein
MEVVVVWVGQARFEDYEVLAAVYIFTRFEPGFLAGYEVNVKVLYDVYCGCEILFEAVPVVG